MFFLVKFFPVIFDIFSKRLTTLTKLRRGSSKEKYVSVGHKMYIKITSAKILINRKYFQARFVKFNKNNIGRGR